MEVLSAFCDNAIMRQATVFRLKTVSGCRDIGGECRALVFLYSNDARVPKKFRRFDYVTLGLFYKNFLLVSNTNFNVD